mmetsp:Transcript_34245/g.34908  ORF Transcript_34245/g.34908 Transcript_34245/m.34908 type:complete len:110 (+) Transcript_34245:61-390(+)
MYVKGGEVGGTSSSSSLSSVLNSGSNNVSVVVDAVYAFFMSLVIPGWETQVMNAQPGTSIAFGGSRNSKGSSGGSGPSARGRAPGPRIAGMDAIRSNNGGGGCAGGSCG